MLGRNAPGTSHKALQAPESLWVLHTSRNAVFRKRLDLLIEASKDWIS